VLYTVEDKTMNEIAKQVINKYIQEEEARLNSWKDKITSVNDGSYEPAKRLGEERCLRFFYTALHNLSNRLEIYKRLLSDIEEAEKDK